MKPLERVAPTGARWLERKENGLYQTVLWSTVLDQPLSIETGDKKAADRAGSR